MFYAIFSQAKCRPPDSTRRAILVRPGCARFGAVDSTPSQSGRWSAAAKGYLRHCKDYSVTPGERRSSGYATPKTCSSSMCMRNTHVPVVCDARRISSSVVNTKPERRLHGMLPWTRWRKEAGDVDPLEFRRFRSLQFAHGPSFPKALAILNGGRREGRVGQAAAEWNPPRAPLNNPPPSRSFQRLRELFGGRCRGLGGASRAKKLKLESAFAWWMAVNCGIRSNPDPDRRPSARVFGGFGLTGAASTANVRSGTDAWHRSTFDPLPDPCVPSGRRCRRKIEGTIFIVTDHLGFLGAGRRKTTFRSSSARGSPNAIMTPDRPRAGVAALPLKKTSSGVGPGS